MKQAGKKTASRAGLLVLFRVGLHDYEWDLVQDTWAKQRSGVESPATLARRAALACGLYFS